eukprot:364973-Chlamydomonas_euryale.AAC.8
MGLCASAWPACACMGYMSLHGPAGSAWAASACMGLLDLHGLHGPAQAYADLHGFVWLCKGLRGSAWPACVRQQC